MDPWYKVATPRKEVRNKGAAQVSHRGRSQGRGGIFADREI